jgi:hypothetical protein
MKRGGFNKDGFLMVWLLNEAKQLSLTILLSRLILRARRNYRLKKSLQP